MQVIASLLNLQAHRLNNPCGRAVLQESRNRIQTLSAVHEALYRSDSLHEIDLESYLSRIVRLLKATYRPLTNRVAVMVDADKIELNIETASPLGLVINELVSNSLKYAFPDDKQGTITIRIRKQAAGLVITVEDDGIGFPEGLNWKEPDTLGLKLVRSLVENQLEGTIELDQAGGTRFTIQVGTLSPLPP